MKKVRQPKSAHRKTQTPIVAKQISSSGKDVSSHNNLPGPALLPNPQRYCARKKSIPFPARETYPATAYEICLASKLYHTFLSFTREFGKNVKKEPILSKDTWRYAKPARAHPPREKASRRAHPCGLPRERTPPPRKPPGLPREEGAGRGRGALTAPQPYRLRGRQRIKDGKGENAFPVWSAMFRLSFVSSVYRPYGAGTRGAGHSGIRRNLWIIRSGP